MSEWISVEERMPTEEESCDGRVAALDDEGYAVIALRLGGKLMAAEGRVTHWMPLPKPPTG